MSQTVTTSVTSVRSQVAPGTGFVLNLETGPVRPVNYDHFPHDAFASVLVGWSEDAYVVISRVPPHSSGPPAHWHDVDQLFFCTTGQLELRVGEDTVTLRPGDLAVIPAGVPHEHRNLGSEEEVHLELIVPGIVPGRPIVHFAESAAEWQGAGQIVATSEATDDARPAVLLRAHATAQSDAPWDCQVLDIPAGEAIEVASPAGAIDFILSGHAETPHGPVAAGSFTIGVESLSVGEGQALRLFRLNPKGGS